MRATVVKKTAADILKDTEGRFFAQLANLKEERARLEGRWGRLQAAVALGNIGGGQS
jgi:hypothetical protein